MHISRQWTGIVAMVSAFSTISAIASIIDGLKALRVSPSIGYAELVVAVGIILLAAFVGVSFRATVIFTLRYLESRHGR